MRSKKKDLAQKIREEVTEELRTFKERFEDFNITWESPRLEIWDSNPRTFKSEIQIYLLKNGDIFDVFEFFVFENGSFVASNEEIRLWIREEAEKLLAQQHSQ